MLGVLARKLKRSDHLEAQALCAYLEPIYAGVTPRSIETFVDFLPAVVNPCKEEKTGFAAWLESLLVSSQRSTLPVIAVLVTDGQLTDDPNAKRIPGLAQKLAKVKNLRSLFVLGLRNDSKHSAAAFTSALGALLQLGKLEFGTNDPTGNTGSWREELGQLERQLR